MGVDYFRAVRQPLCVVGNINRDVKVQGVPRSEAVMEDGETSVAGVVETIGGGGANSACAAAALGAPVRFVGKIGADVLGGRLERALESHGVRCHLRREANCQTGTTVALGWENGQRHFLSRLPNNESLRFEDLDLSALDGCSHLLRADVWFSQAMLDGGNRRLLAAARQRGIPVSLDINFDPYWSTGLPREIACRKRRVRDLLGDVTLAHGNVRELMEFTDCRDLSSALESLSGHGVQGVVVHLGSEGAGFYANGVLTVEPPARAVQPVHSTGTGDVLSVCMILLHPRDDLSIREKLGLSNQVVREFMEGTSTLFPTC